MGTKLIIRQETDYLLLYNDKKGQIMADVKEDTVDQDLEAQEEAQANDNGKMSSKNSDISIEEIGQEEVDIAKAENAEVSLPEEPDEVEEVAKAEEVAKVEGEEKVEVVEKVEEAEKVEEVAKVEEAEKVEEVAKVEE